MNVTPLPGFLPASSSSSWFAQILPCHGGIQHEPIALPLGTINFGRSAHWRIADRRVSRKHCTIVSDLHSKSVTLLPASTNPSYLFCAHNGETVPLQANQPQTVGNGDVLSLLDGELTFRFLIPEPTPSASVPSSLEDEQSTQLVPSIESAGSMSILLPEPANRRTEASSPTLDPDLLIAPEELNFVKTIGMGSCGEVVQARWKGSVVAVKKIFRALLKGDALKEFLSECSILRRLRHPNIVLFMGMYQKGAESGSETGIVTEFVSRGSLSSVLQDVSVHLDHHRKTRIMTDISRGMNYLHTFKPLIIHRDIKSGNVLCNADFSCKIADFGLARFLQTEGETANTFCGTLQWSAPEILANRGHNEKADLYSFAVVCWEIVTRSEPFALLSAPQIITGVTSGRLRPTIPLDTPPFFAEIMERCWDGNPRLRPSFAELLRVLEEERERSDPSPSVGASSALAIPLQDPKSMTQLYHEVARGEDRSVPLSVEEFLPSSLEVIQEAQSREKIVPLRIEEVGRRRSKRAAAVAASASISSQVQTKKKPRLNDSSSLFKRPHAAEKKKTEEERAALRRDEKLDLLASGEESMLPVVRESDSSHDSAKGRLPATPPVVRQALKSLEETPSSGAHSSPSNSNTSLPSPSSAIADTWRLDGAQLQFNKVLGTGGSATVYRGEYAGLPVAVKVLKQTLQEEFLRELAVISAIRHDRLLPLIGAVARPKLALVTELLICSLLDHMQAERAVIGWEKFFDLAQDCVAGVHALHQFSVVHRDVKSGNFLLDEGGRVKLADFGLARFLKRDQETLCQLRGTYQYMAPECYRGVPFTRSSDVFSLAIVLWELVNRAVEGEYCAPYADCQKIRFDFQIIIHVSKFALRPQFPPATPEPLSKVISEMWNGDPSKRPTSSTVLDRMDELKKILQEERGETSKSIN